MIKKMFGLLPFFIGSILHSPLQRLSLQMLWCLSLLLITTNLFGLPKDMKQNILNNKYQYTCNLSKTEYSINEKASIHINVQKAGYNVSGVPVRVELTTGHFSSETKQQLLHAKTSSNGSVHADFFTGKQEGNFTLTISFIHPRHGYVHQERLLNYTVVSKARFYTEIILVLILIIAYITGGFFLTSPENLRLFYIAPVFVKKENFPINIHHQKVLFWIKLTCFVVLLAGVSLSLVMLQDPVLVVVFIAGYALFYKKEKVFEENLVAYGGLIWMLYLILHQYGSTQLMGATMMEWKSGFYGWMALIILLAPAPLLWVPLCVLLSAWTPLPIWVLGGIASWSIGCFVTHIAIQRFHPIQIIKTMPYQTNPLRLLKQIFMKHKR